MAALNELIIAARTSLRGFDMWPEREAAIRKCIATLESLSASSKYTQDDLQASRETLLKLQVDLSKPNLEASNEPTKDNSREEARELRKLIRCLGPPVPDDREPMSVPTARPSPSARKPTKSKAPKARGAVKARGAPKRRL